MSGAPGLSGREATRLWLLQHEFVYRDDREALEDAHRLALLTAVSGAREDRERLRVRTVNALNRARDPLAPRVRGGGPGVDAAFVSAVVLVIVSVALMLVTAGSGPFEPGGGAGDAAAVWFGLLAAIGVGVLAWCDPLRAHGEVWYTGTSTALHLVLAVLLLGAYAFCLIVNLPGIDGFTVLSAVGSGALFVGSAVWLLRLWWRGRHHSDLAVLPLRRVAEPPEGMLRRLDAGRGLVDRADEPALYAVLDSWWSATAAEAELASPGRVAEVRRAILQQSLEDPGLPPKDRAALRRDLASGRRFAWEERRHDWSPR